MTPAEREAHWSLRLLFALEAASENEARTILGQALAGVVMRYVPPGMQPGLPLRDQPVIVPRSQHRADRIWFARLYPDLTHLPVIDPDDATAASGGASSDDLLPEKASLTGYGGVDPLGQTDHRP
jgi:hypothetical protein